MTEAAEVGPEARIFIQIPLEPAKPRTGILIFVGEDGRSVSVACKIEESSRLTYQDQHVLGYLEEVSHGRVRVSVANADYSKLKRIGGFKEAEKNFQVPGKIVENPDLSLLKEMSNALSLANKTAYLARLREIERESEKEKVVGKLGARTFHILTGVLVTPIEMSKAVIKLAVSCAFVAAGCFALLGIQGAKLLHLVKVRRLAGAQKEVLDFTALAIYQMRIALLQLIPIIGAQLANQYIETGSLKRFLEAPAVGGLLEDLGISVLNLVYGSRSPQEHRKDTHLKKLYKDHPIYKDLSYLSKQNPTIEDAKQVLLKAAAQAPPQGALVRIPVKTELGEVRYHDGTMFLSTAKGAFRLNAPTVIMYHGNAMHRDLFLDKGAFKKYLEEGYNVLLSSYAGDYVVQGDGKDHKTVSTQCTEKLMREDAQADLDFLTDKAVGVREVDLYGFSLGGAQAMNFAQAIKEHGPKVRFITLNKTFSDGVSVVARAAKNITGSNFLGWVAATFAKRSFLEETKTEGCDCLDNLGKLKKIVGRPPFASTQFTFIGATEDPLMSDKKDPENNFAADMYLAVQEIVGDRAKLVITLKGHQL